jgi:hypothetical protein
MNDTIDLRRTELEKLQVNEDESESNDGDHPDDEAAAANAAVLNVIPAASNEGVQTTLEERIGWWRTRCE